MNCVPKMVGVILAASALLWIPVPSFAQDVIEKTYCTYAYGYGNAEDMKADLLTSAKRQAVNQLFGELITASTAVENSVVTSDQIQASSLGFVRISGDPLYGNGADLAEVCVTIRTFVTEDDLDRFEPVQLTKRLCQARPDLTADALAGFVKEEAIIQALYDYDASLAGKDRNNVLRLMQRITYRESGFLKDTTTYCVELEGYVTPVEVMAFATFDGLPATNGVSSSQAETATDGHSALASQRTVEPCAEELGYGQMLECSLDSEGQKNRHSFEAAANDRIVVTVVRTEGDIQPWIAVHDKGGQSIKVNGAYNGDCAATDKRGAQAICVVEKSGTLTINVGSAESDTVGSYRLAIQRLNSPELAAPIDFGDAATGAFDRNWEPHYFTFNAESGDRIAVDMVRTIGDIEPWFEVYGKDGWVIQKDGAYNGDCVANGELVAQVICVVEKSGAYTIRAGNSAWDYTGSYALGIQRLNNPKSAKSIDFAEPIENEISKNLEKHYYTFTAEPGDRIEVDVVRTAGDIEPWFAVYGKVGRVIQKDGAYNGDCVANGQEEATITCQLEKSGLYTIVVGNNAWDYTGSYRLTLNRQ